MTEKSGKMDIEKKKAVIVDWVAKFAETSEIGEIDAIILKKVLAHCGADFEQSSEALAPLGEYTNKAKRPGLDAVWGKETVDDFWGQIDLFIKEHEAATGIKLPEIKTKKGYRKFSGMRQFFGEITAFAAGQLDLETFRRYSEARIFNGRRWQEGKKVKRVKISIPTLDESICPSSYPPEYPRFAINMVLSRE